MYGQLSWPVIRVATSSSSACFVRHRGGRAIATVQRGGSAVQQFKGGVLPQHRRLGGGNEGRRELRLKWRVPVSSILN